MPRNPNMKKIVKTKGFKEWWKERKDLKPKIKSIKVARRAYQVDRGIKAKLKDKPYWKEHTNRSDMKAIDYKREPQFYKAKRKHKKR